MHKMQGKDPKNIEKNQLINASNIGSLRLRLVAKLYRQCLKQIYTDNGRIYIQDT